MLCGEIKTNRALWWYYEKKRLFRRGRDRKSCFTERRDRIAKRAAGKADSDT
jgi:hypothetical protein